MEATCLAAFSSMIRLVKYPPRTAAAMAGAFLAPMRHFLDTKTRKFADFAREVFKVEEADDRKAAEAGIARLEAWFKKIGTPVTLAEAGIPAEGVVKMAPDALLTAQGWGLGELYTLESITTMFNDCVK